MTLDSITYVKEVLKDEITSRLILIHIHIHIHIHTDVTLDLITYVKEVVEDEITSRVGGPAYFGWPVKGRGHVTYDDDLSFAHAQGDGLSTIVLLRGRVLRYLAGELRVERVYVCLTMRAVCVCS